MQAYQNVKALPAPLQQEPAQKNLEPRKRFGFRERLRRLRQCRRGLTVIEFAIAGPVVFATVAGVLELALVMFVMTLSEGALREASRFSITGFTPAGMTREERILEILGDHTIGLVDMSEATVAFKVYPTFDDIGKPEPFTDNAPANGSYDAGEAFQDINGNGQWDADMGAAGLGGPGEIVLYTVEFDWKLMTPLVSPFMGTDGKMTMKSSVAVKNEPFSVPPPVPPGGV